jgi:hypothetical protein
MRFTNSSFLPGFKMARPVVPKVLQKENPAPRPSPVLSSLAPARFYQSRALICE